MIYLGDVIKKKEKEKNMWINLKSILIIAIILVILLSKNKIWWAQLLTCEDLTLFCIIHESKLNIFGTIDQAKNVVWVLRNYNRHFPYFLTF